MVVASEWRPQDYEGLQKCWLRCVWDNEADWPETGKATITGFSSFNAETSAETAVGGQVEQPSYKDL